MGFAAVDIREIRRCVKPVAVALEEQSQSDASFDFGKKSLDSEP